MHRVSKFNARAACSYDLLSAYDLQTMHQEEGQTAVNDAVEEKVAVNATAVSQVWRSGSKRASL